MFPKPSFTLPPIPPFAKTPSGNPYDPLAPPFDIDRRPRRQSDPGVLGRSRTGREEPAPGDAVSALDALQAPPHPEFAACAAVTTQQQGPSLDAQIEDCMEQLHFDQGPYGLAELGNRIHRLCDEAGFDMAATHPQTLLYLRYPERADPANALGRGAQSLPAVVNVLRRLIMGHDRRMQFQEGDLERFKSIIPALFAQRASAAATTGASDATPGIARITHSAPTTDSPADDPATPAPPLAALARAPRQWQPATPGGVARKHLELALEIAPNQDSLRRINDALETCRTAFKGHGPQAASLIETLPVDLLAYLIGSMRTYGRLDEELRDRLTFRRDVVNYGGTSKLADANVAITGSKGNFFSDPDCRSHRGGADQVGYTVRVAMATPEGNIAYPVVANLAAPSIDSRRGEEYYLYVRNDALLVEPYREAVETLYELFRDMVGDIRPGRIVLSAIGSNAFLNALPIDQRAVACEILVQQMADNIVWMRQRNIPVVYTDVSHLKPFWEQLNAELASRHQEPVPWIGSIPGEWARDDDLILNSGDKKSLFGNGGTGDRTMDGSLGAWTTGQLQHLLRCVGHARGINLKL